MRSFVAAVLLLASPVLLGFVAAAWVVWMDNRAERKSRERLARLENEGARLWASYGIGGGR